MRLSTFILFVVLLSLIAMLSTHKEVERYRSGYRMGRIVVERDRVRSEIMKREAEVAELRAPRRLEELNTKLGLGLKPLPTGMKR